MSAVPSHFQLTLEDLAKRRRHDRIAIIQLCACVGADPSPWLEDETKPADAELLSAPSETKARGRETKPPKGDTSRPMQASTGDREGRVLAALKKGAAAPKALEVTTGLKRDQVFKALAALVEQKQIRKEGQRRSVVYRTV